jgi:hypothetical protein
MQRRGSVNAKFGNPMKILAVVALVGALSLPSVVSAQSGTAYKTGERRTGRTKQCYYRGLGKDYTETVEGYQLCPLSIAIPSGEREPSESKPSTITAYRSGEDKTGRTKQCFYVGLGKKYTRTIESYQLCPLSIKVPQ